MDNYKPDATVNSYSAPNSLKNDRTSISRPQRGTDFTVFPAENGALYCCGWTLILRTFPHSKSPTKIISVKN